MIGPLRKHARIERSDWVGARIFTVTTLSGGTGTGSFRWALAQARTHAGGRTGTKWAIVEFAVGGIVDFRAGGISHTDGNQGLRVHDCHRIWINGATAPGPVLFYGVPFEIRYSSKILIDHVGFAAGPLWATAGQWDTLRIFGPAAWTTTNSSNYARPNEDVWIDHCSGKWSQDELLSIIQTPQFRISVTNSLWYDPYDKLTGTWDGTAIAPPPADSQDSMHNYGPLTSGKGGWGTDGARHPDPRTKGGGLVGFDFQRNVTGNYALRGPRAEQGSSQLIANNLNHNWEARAIESTNEQTSSMPDAGRQMILLDVLDNVGLPGSRSAAEGTGTSTSGFLRFQTPHHASSSSRSRVGVAGNKRITGGASDLSRWVGRASVEQRWIDGVDGVEGTPYGGDPVWPPGFVRYEWDPREAVDYLLRNAGPRPAERSNPALAEGYDARFVEEVRTGKGLWWTGSNGKVKGGADGSWRNLVPTTEWANAAVPKRPADGLATQAYIDHHLNRVLLDDAPAAPALPQVYDEPLAEALAVADGIADAALAVRRTAFDEPDPLAGWGTPDPTWSGAYAGAATPDGAVLRQSNTGRARKHLAWTAQGAFSETWIEAEVRALAPAPGATLDTAAGVLARVSADGRTGLYAALSRAGGQRTLRLGRYLNGVATNLAEAPFPWSDGAWYRVRLWAQGTRLRAACWADGDPEPLAWGIDATDAQAPAAGLGGLFSYDAAVHEWGDLILATGAVAPRGPEAPTEGLAEPLDLRDGVTGSLEPDPGRSFTETLVQAGVAAAVAVASTAMVTVVLAAEPSGLRDLSTEAVTQGARVAVGLVERLEPLDGYGTEAVPPVVRPSTAPPGGAIATAAPGQVVIPVRTPGEEPGRYLDRLVPQLRTAMASGRLGGGGAVSGTVGVVRDHRGRVILDGSGFYVYAPDGSLPIAPDIVRIDTQHLVDAAISTAKIKPKAVVSDLIDDGAVTETKVHADSIGRVHIKELAVGEAQIADLAVKSAKIADGAILRAKIGELQVVTAHIDDLAVNNAKLANLAVSSAKIQDLAVEDQHVRNLAADKLTAGTIGADVVYAGTLDAGQITTGTLDAGLITVLNLSADAIATGTLDAARVNVANLSASAIVSGTLDARRVTVKNLDAGSIVSGTIGAGVIYAGAVSADAITSGTLDAGLIGVVNLSASSISTGTLDAAKVTVRNLSASAITTGTLDAAQVTVRNLSATNITGGTLSVDRLSANQAYIRNNLQLGDDVVYDRSIRSISAQKLIAGSVITGHLEVGLPLGNNAYSVRINGDHGRIYWFDGNGRVRGILGNTYGRSGATQSGLILYGPDGKEYFNSTGADTWMDGAVIKRLSVDTGQITDLAVSTLKIKGRAVETEKVAQRNITNMAAERDFDTALAFPFGGLAEVIFSCDVVPTTERYSTGSNGDEGTQYALDYALVLHINGSEAHSQRDKSYGAVRDTGGGVGVGVAKVFLHWVGDVPKGGGITAVVHRDRYDRNGAGLVGTVINPIIRILECRV